MTTTDALQPVFNALGDPNRMRLVSRLCDAGPGSTSEVARAVSVSRQAATKHLLLLEEVGLVSSDRRGRERIWRMQPEALNEASDYLDQLARRWDRAIDRLRAFVEDGEQSVRDMPK